MKKLIWIVLWLILLPRCAFAAEEAALFPAKGENGQWGYIDRTGAFVIPPQYAQISPWFGQYAAVSEDGELWGIVDAKGDFALPMEYVIDWATGDRAMGVYDTKSPDIKPTYAVTWSDAVCGVFDTQTGFFSGFRWRSADVSSGFDTPWVAVMDDSMTWGFADAATGPW